MIDASESGLRQHTGRGARQHKTEANFSSCSVATGSSSKTWAQGSDQVSGYHDNPKAESPGIGPEPIGFKFKLPAASQASSESIRAERSGFRSARYAIGISDSAE